MQQGKGDKLDGDEHVLDNDLYIDSADGRRKLILQLVCHNAEDNLGYVNS